MTRIIKRTEGEAYFVKTEEFEDEADAEVGDNPVKENFEIDEIKIENIKWKQKK